MKFLIVEDTPELLDAVTQVLEAEGFLCEQAADFETARQKLSIYQYDILIVDLNLPYGSGLDLIRMLKKENPETGIIVISARDSLEQKIEGLELGADDYLTKPFALAELVVRVKSLLRRKHFGGSQTFVVAGLEIDTLSRSVRVNGRDLSLTKSEYDILLLLISNPGRVLTRESIAEHVWGDNSDLMDSFDFIYSHIKNLRKKIAATGLEVPFRTVYGVGYRFDP